jgi:hypothetical protein
VTEILALDTVGKVTVMACPRCKGTLYEIADRENSWFYCAEGHGYSLDEVCPDLEEGSGGFLAKAIRVISRN